MIQVEEVALGLVLRGGKRFSDNNVSPTFRAPIQLRDSTATGYVKIVPPHEVAAESVCAVAGRALGIPIPRPIIVWADHDSLPEVVPAGRTIITFACEDAGHPSFKRRIQNSAIHKALKKCPHSPAVGAFDEWTANWDRNTGNILYDGGVDFYFIDHGKAFSEPLAPSQPASRNKLLELLRLVSSEGQIRGMFKAICNDFVPKLLELQVQQVLESGHAGDFLGPGRREQS